MLCSSSFRFDKAVFDSLAEEFGGSTKVVRGEELLKEGDSYPMVRFGGGSPPKDSRFSRVQQRSHPFCE